MTLRQLQILDWVSTFGIFVVAAPHISNTVLWVGIVVLVTANGIINRRIGYRQSTNDSYKKIDRKDMTKDMETFALTLFKLQRAGHDDISIGYVENGVDKELHVILKDVEV